MSPLQNRTHFARSAKNRPIYSMPTVAFVGCAHIHTPSFVKRLAANDAFTVKSVWDHDEARGRKGAEALGAHFTANADSIWSDPEIEAAIICSETSLHKTLVPHAAKAKKHLFVEKPLGMNGRETREMADALNAAGVTFSSGYFMRGEPVMQYLKKLVDDNAFGQITRVRSSNCHDGALGGWFDNEWRWMADVDRAGVGAFGDLGTHGLDLLLWMFGDLDSVTAATGMGTARYPGCDETGEGLLRFQSGAIGTITAAWDDVANPVRYLISGTEGHAAIIDGQLFLKCKNIEGADGKTPWTDLAPAVPAGYDGFLAALTGDKSAILVSPDEAAYRTAVFEAMYEGARRSEWVKINK
jgi:predicted dehydrogenase